VPGIRIDRRRSRRRFIPSSIVEVALIAFIALKLAGVIHWSWWWVLSPIWISAILIVLGVSAVLIELRWRSRRKARQWMDQLGPDWISDFMAGKTSADGAASEHRDLLKLGAWGPCTSSAAKTRGA
jgi:Transmembrane Fragile-X-F protein